MKRSLFIFLSFLFLTQAWANSINAQTPAKETTATAQPTATANMQGQDIQGSWQGMIEAGSTRLRVILKLIKASNGTFKATLDSPDQGATDLPIDTVVFKDNMLRFEMKKLSAEYEGTLSRDGLQILGTWKQGGQSLGLIFRRPDKRPQSSAVAAAAVASVQRGRVQLKPCGRDGLPNEALCGSYEVFEDRRAAKGRKIALSILLLPALNEKAAADPLFYLAGGPGAAATSYATAGFMTRFRRERDVVLVDQRGTGNSNPLQCSIHGERNDMRGFFTDYYSDEAIRACRAELEKVANLTLYTTEIAMDDLDEVRAALGYERINLYGGSYGTRAALAYLRQHPKQVRTVALFGVAPPEYKIPLPFAKGVQHAMNRLMEDCAADAECRTAFPDFRAEFEASLAKLDKGPIKVTAMNVVTKQPQEITLSRGAFVDIVRLMLYFPPTISVLPRLIHQASQGNFGPMVTIAFQVYQQLEGQIARGMQLSVICAEDLPFITDEEIRRETAGTFYGETRVRAYQKACAAWPKGAVPPDFATPLKSDAPVLLVSGEVDPVTPPWIAEAAARNLPNGRQVRIRNGSHYSYDCAENLVAEFIDRGTTQGLDISCLEQIRRLPFNTGK
ncbi:MAG TPA: alpha/beta hydrolase [Pyrinomonadaceae bacterium]